MKHKKLLSLFLLVLIPFIMQAQEASMERAPYIDIKHEKTLPSDLYPNSLAYAHNVYGTTIPTGLFRFYLNNPAGMQSIGNFTGSDFCSGAAWAADGFLYGTGYTATPPSQFFKIDTSTGNRTVIGPMTGALGSCTGLAYDWTTNTMYAMTYSTNSYLWTVNLTTGAVTQVGTGSITGLVIDIACDPTGQLYGIDITVDQLIAINKTTGVATVVGPLGLAANYAQGFSCDQSDGTLYWASYGTTGELRTINKLTGTSTVVGAFGVEVDGFAIPGGPGPNVAHVKLPNTENLTGPYVVNAIVTPLAGSTIASVKLYWSRNNTTLTDSVTMTNPSGTNWTGNIPGNGAAATYRYQIRAKDNLGRLGQTGILQFEAAIDNQKPVIIHTPLGNMPLTAWPALVMANVTDNLGLDSVWVKWYKNTPTTIKQFKLLPQGNNVFQALFNSTQAEVALNDSIFYRIFAKDNSTAHNVDSTALYKFKFVPIATIQIGTGTVAYGYPYYTFYHDSRTQMLWLGSEITGAGGGPGGILALGFNVVTAATQAMNGFYIRMKNTPLTTLTAWETTGWTDVYSGTYTVPGTGWQMVTLTTPFLLLPGQNLLVEICFDNTSYTSNSTVNGTAMTGVMYHQHVDNGAGCTLSGTNSAVGRPNVKFTIDFSYVPVEFTSFSSVIDRNNVVLNWSTATEKNNNGFSVERKVDGGTWQSVGFVKGAGTTTEAQNYTFTDKGLTVGNYTYRLKQIDFDGSFAYSNEISADLTGPVQFSLEQNYPNPFNPSTTISFGIATDSKVMLRLFDVTGQEIMTLVNKEMKAGRHQVEFNASNLNSGVYFYKLEAGNFSSIKKMMLIK
jgi:hypothetical protein